MSNAPPATVAKEGASGSGEAVSSLELKLQEAVKQALDCLQQRIVADMPENAASVQERTNDCKDIASTNVELLPFRAQEEEKESQRESADAKGSFEVGSSLDLQLQRAVKDIAECLQMRITANLAERVASVQKEFHQDLASLKKEFLPYLKDDKKDGPADTTTTTGQAESVPTTEASVVDGGQGAGLENLLPEDTYSFFVVRESCSQSFACATLVLVCQALTFFFLLRRENVRENENILQVPANVTGGVRACQVLAILISLVSEDNVVGSLNAWSSGFDEEALKKAKINVTNHAYLRWNASAVLRLSEGFLALVATVILIMQTESARDVLLNFTAVRFVSLLDNVVFSLAGYGYWGGSIQEDVKKTRGVKVSAERRANRFLRVTYLPVNLPVMLSLWLWISLMQERGDFLCERIYVQFGDSILPDLSYFSGMYTMQKKGGWGDKVEYVEEPHVVIDGSYGEKDYVPARFGYCHRDGAWVFAHGKDPQSEPDLCRDWALRSEGSDSFDITNIGPRWFANLKVRTAPLDYFHLSCHDCNKDESFCGDHGSCSNNRCLCDDGWFGLQCQFPEPCDSLQVDVTTKAFPSKLALGDLEWPVRYELLGRNITVNHSPIYVHKSWGLDNYEFVVVLYSGRRWEFLHFSDFSPPTKNEIKPRLAGFHGHWTRTTHFIHDFTSQPMNVDEASFGATPEGLVWFDVDGVEELIETAMVCEGPLNDGNIREAARDWTEQENFLSRKLYGKFNAWNTSFVTDMSYVFAKFSGANPAVSHWDMSGVWRTVRMFWNAKRFNRSLNSWDMSNLMDMSRMFEGAISFNSNLSEWDTVSLQNMSSAFRRARNFNQDISRWNTTSVKDMKALFNEARAYNQDLSKWDTSSAQDMSGMFRQATSFNQNISLWNTSSVEGMEWMFSEAVEFNQSLNQWNTSSVRDMSYMFHCASSFNQNLSLWNVSAVKNMSSMFKKADSFNQDISTWETSSVKDMHSMFASAGAFNTDISRWDTSKVISMFGMFNATSFNRDISAWNTSSVQNMGEMFLQTEAFNNDISKWDTSKVRSMSGMFWSAKSFNHDLSLWDTGSVENMYQMFAQAKAFNSDISKWDVSNVRSMFGMFWNAKSFNQNLLSWKTTSVDEMQYMFLNAISFNQNLSLWNTSSVKEMQYMFLNAKSFNQNLSLWNTASVIDMRGMFLRAESFNQTLCWDLHPDVRVQGMFCGSNGSFHSACVSEKRLKKSQKCKT